MKYDVIIVASGKGQRANLGYNKVFYIMENGKSVLENAAFNFINDDDCKRIIVVTNKDEFDRVFINEKTVITEGGKERKDSVTNGLKLVESEYVMIHDGARPFLHKNALNSVKEALEKHDAVMLAKKATDTIKVVKNGIIEKTIDRNTIYMAETPQAFKSDLIKDAYSKETGLFTDDASLLEGKHPVYIVEDEYNNAKMTLSSDFKDR